MDISKFAEQEFANWGWWRLLLAFVSVIALLLLALALADRLPSLQDPNGKIKSPGGTVLHRLLALDNEREISSLPGGYNLSRRYGIAWIYGSEATIRSAPDEWMLHGRRDYELTEVLADYVKNIGDRSVVVHEFRQSGVRTGDLRRAVLYAATAPEIGAVIMPVCPMWAFNDYLLFNPSKHRAELLNYHDLDSVDYQVAAALLRPSDIAAWAVRQVFPVFEHRKDVQRAYFASDRLPFMANTRVVNRMGDMVAVWQSLLFPRAISETPATLSGSERLRAGLLMGNLSASSMGARIFRANLETLAKSGKPVILYIQPLHPAIRTDLQAMERVNQFIQLTREVVDEIHAPNMVLVSGMALNPPPLVEHIDLYHLKYGQGVVQTLVDSLEQLGVGQIRRESIATIYGARVVGDTTGGNKLPSLSGK